MKNYYEILEVNENASKEVIDKAYKVLAQQEKLEKIEAKLKDNEWHEVKEEIK